LVKMEKVKVKVCKHLYGGNYGFHCEVRKVNPYLSYEHSKSTHIGDCGYFRNCEMYESEEIEATPI